MSLTVVGAIASFGFLLLLISKLIEKQHFILKISIYLFIIVSLISLGKAGIDSVSVCEPVINSTTLTNNITSYTYSTYCYTNTTSNNGVNFYKLVLGFVVFFFIYMFTYLGYYSLNYAGNILRRR